MTDQRLQLNKSTGPKLKGKAPEPEQPKNAEADSLAELSEVLDGFKQRAEREQERFVDATDSEYWIAVCFQTRAQKEEFLEKLGLLADGDKYLDGLLVARKLGITIESPTPGKPKLKIDSKLTAMSLPLKRQG